MTTKTSLLKSRFSILTTLIAIIFLGLFFRTVGFNWDQDQHLHPDERFLTMVLTDIKIPSSLSQYLDPNNSTLNPYNANHLFYVYGSFPINIVKVLGVILGQDTYYQIHFIGRSVIIVLDTLIIILIFLISQKIFNSKIGLFSSFLYATCVLPIQLSHFYTVDPFLNFFTVLTFYFLVSLKNNQKILLKILLLSTSFSLALASKISAIYFSPVILVFFIFYFIKKPIKLIYFGTLFLIFTAIFFRFNQPQFFSSANFLNWHINPQFIKNINELKSYNDMSYYPPGIQWLKVTPLIFPLKNIIFWGTGLPLGIIFMAAIIYSIFLIFFKKSFQKKFFLFTILFWILLLFFYQGSQHVSTIRYFLPIFPFLCLVSGYFIYQFKIFKKPLVKIFLIIILLVYPFSFISIYLKDHSRVAASKWIYQNIPIGSTIATEYWDDSLPLSIGDSSYSFYNYQNIAVADPESPEKMAKINDQLSNSDYLILSSNRFYLPIPKNFDIYPSTAKYYQSLFDGSLGFQKVAEFDSFPCFPPFGKQSYCLDDTYSEEAFTVYDHPKVIIFKKY